MRRIQTYANDEVGRAALRRDKDALDHAEIHYKVQEFGLGIVGGPGYRLLVRQDDLLQAHRILLGEENRPPDE